MEQEHWYFGTPSGTRSGPISRAELEGLRITGPVTADTLVWKAGMAGWAPYREVLGGPAAPDLTGAIFNPYLPPRTDLSRRTITGTYTRVQPICTFTFLCLCGVVVLGTLLSILLSDASIRLGRTLFFASLASVAVINVLGLVALFRAWKGISSFFHTRTTPGKAVGFLFIPLFNLYWQFVAFGGLARDFNYAAASLHDTTAPRMHYGLFVAVFVSSICLSVVPLVVEDTLEFQLGFGGLWALLWMFLVWKMITVVNHMARMTGAGIPETSASAAHQS